MSNLELHISNIVDTVNDELAGLNPSEQASVWVSAKELIDECVQSLVSEAMKVDKELKPCPFCSCEVNLQDGYSSKLDKKCWKVWHLCGGGLKSQYTHYDELGGLAIVTPWFDSCEEAIEAWNTQVERSK